MPPVQGGQRHDGTRERMEKSRVEMMRGDAETVGCRRQALLVLLFEQVGYKTLALDVVREAGILQPV